MRYYLLGFILGWEGIKRQRWGLHQDSGGGDTFIWASKVTFGEFFLSPPSPSPLLLPMLSNKWGEECLFMIRLNEMANCSVFGAPAIQKDLASCLSDPPIRREERWKGGPYNLISPVPYCDCTLHDKRREEGGGCQTASLYS